jgi:hypothetical protein
VNIERSDTALRLAIVAGVDMLDNPGITRGEYIVAPHGFGFDGGQRPAIVMHPLDAIALRIAVNTRRKMNDLDVMTEALVLYVERRAASRARTAFRTLDLLVESGDERTRVQVEMFLHPLEHGMTYDVIRAIAACQECDYTVTDEEAHRYGMRVQL